MAAINNVVTRGYSIGTIALVVLRGFTPGAAAAIAGYAVIQTAALAVLRKLSEFDSNNSTENDFRILGLGGKEQYCILRRGVSAGRSGQQDVIANGVYGRRGDRKVILEVYVPHVVDSLTTRSTLNTIVQTILDHFDKWPNLDGTSSVKETDADRGKAPEEFTFGSGRFVRQILELNVVQEITTVVA